MGTELAEKGSKSELEIRVNILTFFLAIFRNEITTILTILTPSTSEGGECGRWGWSRFSFWRSLIMNQQC